MLNSLSSLGRKIKQLEQAVRAAERIVEEQELDLLRKDLEIRKLKRMGKILRACLSFSIVCSIILILLLIITN